MNAKQCWFQSAWTKTADFFCNISSTIKNIPYISLWNYIKISWAWVLRLWEIKANEIILVVASFFLLKGILPLEKTCIPFDSIYSLSGIGVFLTSSVFICSHRFRLIFSIFGIVGFNIWLVKNGADNIAVLQKSLTKETAFIIAVAILAWLAMSCYVLSLLKDNQSENE
ncbi:MAG: hypothetical protein ACKN9W_12695 [Methylococcus sp.]